jgi:uncharacterized RDD family membrane protein YckC
VKCPKCHYLSFEPELRCRHCGYDFSLAEPDLIIAPAEPRVAPRADLQLRPARPVPVTTSELPLFVKGLPQNDTDDADADADADEPRLEVPAAPRPLAVRRAMAEGRPHAARPAMALASKLASPPRRGLLEGLQQVEADAVRDRSPDAALPDGGPVAGNTRLAAAAADLLLLVALDLAVFGLTLRQGDVPLAQATSVLAAPLVFFLLVLDLGYLLLFTVIGGQTVGKMLLGLRVVARSPDGGPAAPMTAAQAVSRALLTIPSVLALGAGFLPALVGQGLALHDRLTRTRVVHT